MMQSEVLAENLDSGGVEQRSDAASEHAVEKAELGDMPFADFEAILEDSDDPRRDAAVERSRSRVCLDSVPCPRLGRRARNRNPTNLLNGQFATRRQVPNANSSSPATDPVQRLGGLHGFQPPPTVAAQSALFTIQGGATAQMLEDHSEAQNSVRFRSERGSKTCIYSLVTA